MIQTHHKNAELKQVDCPEGCGFEVNEFDNHSLQQIAPFKSSDQHFAIILYFNGGDEYSNNPERNDNSTGFLIFKSPGESNKITECRNISNGYYIQFTEKFLLRNRPLLSIITGFPFFEISLLRNKPLVINAVESEKIKELYKKIFEEYNFNYNNDGFEIVTVYLQAFFLSIKRLYDSHSNTIKSEDTTQKSQSGEITRKFKSLVWLHTISIFDKSCNRKTVTEYADLLFIHPNYLYAVVKKETGKTAREYIDEQIFKVAKTLLLQEELLIKEIAWQLSFSETAHFCNFFRRHAGIAPGVFRKQYLCATA